MGIRVALVSCVKSKQDSPAPAGDLYTSPTRTFGTFCPPSTVCCILIRSFAPYERTLNAMRKSDRLAWARRVQKQIMQVLPPDAEVIVLAGLRYREELIPFLRKRGFGVTVPLEGLGFGKQLQRLKGLEH